MNEDLSTWDEPQLDPFSPPPNSFEGLSLDEAVELIKDWFLGNFEDPAQETPYDSQEGGYLYIWGGPYDAQDVIENVFADTASPEVIEAAVAAVEAEGIVDWAPHGRRIQPPYDDPPDVTIHDALALHSRMLEHLEIANNALRLAEDGRLLFEHGRNPTSLALAVLSLEETGKYYMLSRATDQMGTRIEARLHISKQVKASWFLVEAAIIAFFEVLAQHGYEHKPTSEMTMKQLWWLQTEEGIEYQERLARREWPDGILDRNYPLDASMPAPYIHGHRRRPWPASLPSESSSSGSPPTMPA